MFGSVLSATNVKSDVPVAPRPTAPPRAPHILEVSVG